MLLMIENAVGIGLQTLGLGMLIVIGILALLMLILYILIPIFRKIAEGKKAKSAPKKEPEGAAEPVPVLDDESDIVAAIVAAISAQTGKAPTQLKVVSFKRIK